MVHETCTVDLSKVSKEESAKKPSKTTSHNHNSDPPRFCLGSYSRLSVAEVLVMVDVGEKELYSGGCV